MLVVVFRDLRPVRCEGSRLERRGVIDRKSIFTLVSFFSIMIPTSNCYVMNVSFYFALCFFNCFEGQWMGH